MLNNVLQNEFVLFQCLRPVRPCGAIPPAALTLAGPSRSRATGGYAVRIHWNNTTVAADNSPPSIAEFWFLIISANIGSIIVNSCFTYKYLFYLFFMIFICIFAKSLVSSRTRLGTAKLILKDGTIAHLFLLLFFSVFPFVLGQVLYYCLIICANHKKAGCGEARNFHRNGTDHAGRPGRHQIIRSAESLII